MLTAVRRDQAQVHNLPGRDWFLYIGPESSPAQNMTVEFATFPAGSAPPDHVHPTQEEIIYITAGRGELVTPEGTATLEPGTVVYIPVGLHHATVSNGPGPLEMVTSFSPPIVHAAAAASPSWTRAEQNRHP